MKCLLSLLCLGLVSCASSPTRTVAPTHLSTLYQKPHQSFGAFVFEASRFVRDYTDQTGHEAGGLFCHNKETHQASIMVFTSHAHVLVHLSEVCPLGGFDFTKDYLHSHPTAPIISFNQIDEDFYPSSLLANLLMPIKKGKSAPSSAFRPKVFSKADRKLGWGYVVASDELYYQQGGKQMFVGLLSNPPPHLLIHPK